VSTDVAIDKRTRNPHRQSMRRLPSHSPACSGYAPPRWRLLAPPIPPAGHRHRGTSGRGRQKAARTGTPREIGPSRQFHQVTGKCFFIARRCTFGPKVCPRALAESWEDVRATRLSHFQIEPREEQGPAFFGKYGPSTRAEASRSSVRRMGISLLRYSVLAKAIVEATVVGLAQ
jgi:hypothetical protein